MQDDSHVSARLAPLDYLQSIPPQRRHVIDEMALIRLANTFSPSHAVRRHPPSIRS